MADYAYCSIQDVKDRLDITGSSDDTMLLDIVRAATEIIDGYYRRRFIPETATKRYDGSGTTRLFVDDLLAVTSLIDDDDTWSTTDYLLYPRTAGGTNGPYTWIEVDPDGQYSAFTRERDIVVIAGRWGAYEDTTSTGATVASNPLSDSDTSLEVATGSTIYPGHVLLIESEQIFVTAQSTGSPNDTYTIERGVNGTTAAEHSQGTAINRYRPPFDILELCVELTSRLFKMRDTAYQDATANVELGALQYRRSVRTFLRHEAPVRWYKAGLR